MKSVIIAAVAALSLFALPAQAAEKPAAAGQKLAAAGDMSTECKKAMDDCQAKGMDKAACEKDADVMKACAQK